MMIDAQLLTFMRDSSRGYPSLPLKKDVFNGGGSNLSDNCKTAIPSSKLLPTSSYSAPSSSAPANHQAAVSQHHIYMEDINFQDVLHSNTGYCNPVFPFGVANSSFTSQNTLQDGQTGVHYLYDTEDETCDSDESEDDSMEAYDGAFESEPDDPSKLLNFVQAVTRDLHSMFSRNKGSEDYCDIYEERFKTTLSGRELYYADLLALASNSEVPSSRRGSRRNLESTTTSETFTPSPVSNCSNSPTAMRGSEHTIIYDSMGEPQTCHLPQEGRCIAAYGLGPLEELFRKSTSTSTSTSQVFTHFNSLGSYADFDNFRNYGTYKNNDLYNISSVPMTMRKLPNSFWIEPGNETKNVLPAISRTPDFSELFVQWGT